MTALLLAACGGEQGPGMPLARSEPLTVESIFGPPSPVMTAAMQRAEVVRAAALAGSSAVAAATEQAVLTVEDENGRQSQGFDLRSVHGKGFPDLKIIVRGLRAGEPGPPVPLRPVCTSSDRCEYRLGGTYVLSLSNDANLKLVARDNALALVARALSVDAAKVAELQFTQGARILDRRKVILLSAAAPPKEATSPREATTTLNEGAAELKSGRSPETPGEVTLPLDSVPHSRVTN